MTKRFDLRQAGFSLVELLVAMVFMSLLMAGMAKIFSSSIQTFTTSNEILGAQRVNRWALELLSDDISQAGFVFPERPMPTHVFNNSNQEPLFSITPGVLVPNVMRVSDTDPNQTEAEAIRADELQFFTDIALPIQATWAADTAGEDAAPGGTPTSAPATVAVTPTVGNLNQLRRGDVMIILDSGEYGSWETPLIAGPGNPIAFETDATELLKFSATPKAPGIVLAHKQGVPVFFVRPAQLVRFSVRAIALDPSNEDVTIPCLVKQQADYPVAGNVAWNNVPAQVIAENVQAFRVDISFDGGLTWERSLNNPATWDQIRSNINTRLGTIGMAGFTSISDPRYPDWWRNVSCLMRLDITTRTALRRSEYSNDPTQREYRTRTQTLMISPRNFGYGR